MIIGSDVIVASVNKGFDKNRFVDAGTSIAMNMASLGMPLTKETIQNSDYSFMFICGVSACDGDDTAGI